MGRRLIVGLGNPGDRFDGTRHNVGFDVVSRLASLTGHALARPLLRQVLVTRPIIQPALAMPLTYMNRSGDVLAWLMRRAGVEADDLCVVVDNMDLPPGQLRMKRRGSAAGHNGLRSIEAVVGEEYARIYIGVGRPAPDASIIDHVLGRGDEEEQTLIRDAVERLAETLAADALQPMDQLISRVNALRYHR